MIYKCVLEIIHLHVVEMPKKNSFKAYKSFILSVTGKVAMVSSAIWSSTQTPSKFLSWLGFFAHSSPWDSNGFHCPQAFPAGACSLKPCGDLTDKTIVELIAVQWKWDILLVFSHNYSKWHGQMWGGLVTEGNLESCHQERWEVGFG